MKKNKVIFIDWGVFVHKAIYAWKNNKDIPPTYTAMRMIIGNLKKIGVNKDDILILAQEGGRSWRKDVDPNYKANRKGVRDSQTDIPWKKFFKQFDDLADNLEYATPIHVLKIKSLEADDIIAEGCRYWEDKECVIISHDQDYEQLMAYDNVKIFSPTSKDWKILVDKNPYLLLQKKINSEPSDNLTSPIITPEDYEIREKIVSLLTLPEQITKEIIDTLDEIDHKKKYDINNLRFHSLKTSFKDIYSSKNVIPYDKTLKKYLKKKQETKAASKNKKRKAKINKLFD